MAFSRSVFPILVLSVVSCYANIQVPVFLWGDIKTIESIKSNPLRTVPHLDFEEILSKQIKGDHFTVIFADKSLSVEDFSYKNDEGETLFSYLKSQLGHAVYLPAVEKPLSVLNEVVNPENVDHVQLTNDGLSPESEREGAKILLITLRNDAESRESLLVGHNAFMKDMYAKLQNKYKRVLAIYTADSPSIPESHSRVRRQAVVSLNDYNFNGLKLFVENLVLSVKDASTNLTTITSQSSNINNTNMQTILNFGENKLTLNFTQSSGYWYFTNVVLEQSEPELVKEMLYPKEQVYSIVGFSYRCGQNVIFNSINNRNSYSLHFKNLKIQPFFSETNESLVFGDSLNCVGFFTEPIWSGLFVTFILLVITFYGIMMMMDIRTMDRFDDPKGKTITINANE